MNLGKLCRKHGVQAILRVFAFVARRERLAWLSGWLGRAMATVVRRSRGMGQARDAADLGGIWQRAFPSTKQVPIESITDHTVMAQIRTPCPLRGTGDLDACHRMMAFDRSVVERSGGRFIVIESQATPGVTICRVAMRMADQPFDDLVPAHRRAAQDPLTARNR